MLQVSQADRCEPASSNNRKPVDSSGRATGIRDSREKFPGVRTYAPIGYAQHHHPGRDYVEFKVTSEAQLKLVRRLSRLPCAWASMKPAAVVRVRYLCSNLGQGVVKGCLSGDER